MPSSNTILSKKRPKNKSVKKMTNSQQQKFNKIKRNLNSLSIKPLKPLNSKHKRNRQLYYIKNSKCTELRSNFIPTIKTQAPISIYGNTRNTDKSYLEKIKFFYEKVFNIREDYVELDMSKKSSRHTKGYIYENKKYCEIFNNELIATPELFYKLFNDYTTKMTKIIKICDKGIKKYNDTKKQIKNPIVSNNSNTNELDELKKTSIMSNNFLSQEIDIFLPGLHSIKTSNQSILDDNMKFGLFLLNNSWDKVRPLELIKLFHDFVNTLKSVPYYKIILDINKFDTRLTNILSIYNDIQLYIIENKTQIERFNERELIYLELLEEIELKREYNSISHDIKGNLYIDEFTKNTSIEEIYRFNHLLHNVIENPILLPYFTLEHLYSLNYKLNEYNENKSVIDTYLNKIEITQQKLEDKKIELDTQFNN